MLTDIMNHHMLDVITDQRVIRWLEILYSLATRTPRIVLDRVEETLPTLRRSMSIRLNSETDRQTQPTCTVVTEDKYHSTEGIEEETESHQRKDTNYTVEREEEMEETHRFQQEDTSHTIERAREDTNHAIERAQEDTNHTVERAQEDTNQEDTNH
ncbi:hypothetical protein L798_07304 [Zootermopsis nevadensis]|uniref:Uncharacterized protein n=1 Tax=Zootermopsis nevadensis TaxID=136037 RepID=A0A067RFD3_ZOONE|nr:hypothetical protein L798_07304 [Zootermopsis nevadensis]